jgi:hypothetical protein
LKTTVGVSQSVGNEIVTDNGMQSHCGTHAFRPILTVRRFKKTIMSTVSEGCNNKRFTGGAGIQKELQDCAAFVAYRNVTTGVSHLQEEHWSKALVNSFLSGGRRQFHWFG